MSISGSSAFALREQPMLVTIRLTEHTSPWGNPMHADDTV